MKIDSLQALMTEELRDVYDAEKQITRALPKMVRAVESDDLKAALKDHLEVTKKQVERLERVFDMLGQPARGRHCPGMRGIIEEGEEVAKRDTQNGLGDEGIIGAAQKVEHYEIAAYGTLRNFALKLGKPDVAELLGQTLQEEKDADQKLTEVAEQLLSESGLDEDVEDEEADEEMEEDDFDESAEIEEEEGDAEEIEEDEDRVAPHSQPAVSRRSPRPKK